MPTARFAPRSTQSCVVALPSVTASGRLLHAHNLDWRQESADSSIVLRVLSDHGPDILTLVEAGGQRLRRGTRG